MIEIRITRMGSSEYFDVYIDNEHIEEYSFFEQALQTALIESSCRDNAEVHIYSGENQLAKIQTAKTE